MEGLKSLTLNISLFGVKFKTGILMMLEIFFKIREFEVKKSEQFDSIIMNGALRFWGF